MNRYGKATATLGLALSAIAVSAAMGAGAGTRHAIWDFRQGFRILNWAAWLGIGGTAMSLAGAILARPGRGRRGFLPAVAGIVLGAVAFGVPGCYYRLAKQLPMIHDITTDTENPPAFVSVLPLRKDAPNSATYGGAEVAARQHAAYPEIRPLVSDLPPARAFGRALSVARQMGWNIVDENRPEGRIEATAVTRWFGFKDDIVIRIAPAADNGSRVDIRSVSRVGRSDIGTNARRIREFLKKFADASKTGG
ncbi:MAG: DUF1499 domain-containing protein [bacterium]|jgi:uncharacterized protein (DUF1499 family)